MSAALKVAKENRDMLNNVIEAVDKLTRMQAKATKQTEKATEATIKFTKSSSSFNKEMEDGTNNFDRRTQAINRAIKKMEGMGKQFELLNYQSLQAFRKEQGNIFEYLDMLLTSTKEQVKILGIEAGTARRVLYGFFPPGMFSLVSKLSTGMKFAGAVTRQFSDSTDEAGKKQKNLFTTIGKGMGFLTKFRKRAITAKEATEEMSEVIEKSPTVSDMSKAEGAIQQQIEAEKSVSVFGGLFGENTHIDEENRRTKGHKLAAQGIGDTEETLSTVLSASPEALYKNMELALKASEKAYESAFEAEKQLRNDNIKNHKERMQLEQERINTALALKEEAVKKASEIEEKLQKEAYDNAYKKAVELEKEKSEAMKKAGIKRRVREEDAVKRRLKDGSMQEEEFGKLESESGELTKAMEDLFAAIALTKDREQSMKVLEKQLEGLSTIRDEVIENFDEQQKEREERDKAAKKAEKARKKANKIATNHLKWEQIRAKIQDFRENKLGPLRESAKMFMFGMMKAIAIVIAALVVFQALWPTIKEVMGTVIDVMLYGVGLVMEGVIQIFTGLYGIYEALMGGDLMDLLMALGDVVIGFGKVLWGLISAVFGTLLIFVGGLFVELAIKAWEWVTSLSLDVKGVGKIVGLALMVLVFIKLWLMGAPIILIIALGILAYKIGKWAIKKIAGIIPGMASGGVSSGGLTLVGEQGPELVNLPKGSRVHSNSQSKRMISGSGTTNNFNITINARDTSDSELRRIADKIGQMVNTRINRTTSSSTMR